MLPGTLILDEGDTDKSSELVDTGFHIDHQVSKVCCNILKLKTFLVCHNENKSRLGLENKKNVNMTRGVLTSSGRHKIDSQVCKTR